MATVDYASELSSFFNAHRGTPVSIEYYPPDSPLLMSGPNIAIPKSYLIGAFNSAFATFNALLPTAPWGAEDARALLDATLILILVAAEHTTAVNTRRRILKLGLGDRVVMPRDEIKLLEGILTSHLAKHNKSPSLWYYRRWIVETYGVEVLGEGGIKEELEVVMRSAEAHPRNYYAWSYARFIVDKFYSADGPQSGKYNTLPPPLRELIESHAVLCRTHVSDTSFWSFLLFLLYKALEEESPSGGSGHGYAFNITKDAAIYAHDIARGHESVWVFIRTVMIDKRLLEKAQQEELIGMVKNWVQEKEEEEARGLELGLEKKVLRWISRRSTSKCSSKFPLAAGSGEVHVINFDI